MLFVVSNDFTSSQLRGYHVAEALGVKCLFADLGGARNQTVVFVKDADRGLVEDAKDRNNRVVLDVIDLYCKEDRSVPFEDLVDVAIVPNSASIEFYKQRFKNADFRVIPHQWDARIKGTARQDFCRTAYIGKHFNKPSWWGGMSVENSGQFLQAAPMFNLHLGLNQRTERMALLKPSTKVVTAAAVLANVVTYKDPGAVELLGWDYPFYVHDGMEVNEAIVYAQKNFGGGFWKQAREKMKEVKEKTSLEAVCKLYGELE